MFKNEVAEFIYKRTYSRWIEEENRREDWPETIERFIGFIRQERPDIPEKTEEKIRKYMTEFAVMPSMRFLWAAGPAAKADNTTICRMFICLNVWYRVWILCGKGRDR